MGRRHQSELAFGAALDCIILRLADPLGLGEKAANSKNKKKTKEKKRKRER